MIEVTPVERLGYFFQDQKTKIHLDGNLLCIHQWVTGTYISVFLDASDVAVSKKKRFEARPLYYSLLIPLFALVPAALMEPVWRLFDLPELDDLTLGLISACYIGFIGLLSLFWFIRFLVRRKSFQLVYFDTEEDTDVTMEYWYNKDFVQATDELVQNLSNPQKAFEKPSRNAYGVVQELDLVYPWRAALATFVSWVLSIYVLLGAISLFTNLLPENWRPGSWILLSLIIIPVLAAVYVFYNGVRLDSTFKHKCRELLEITKSDDTVGIDEELRKLVREYPEEPTTLMFSFRIMLGRKDYEKAMHAARVIRDDDEELGEYLMELVEACREWTRSNNPVQEAAHQKSRTCGSGLGC